MSDRINALPWQPWSLKDFASQSEAPLSESMPDISLLFPNEPMEATAAVDEQQVLVNLQLEAEKQAASRGLPKACKKGWIRVTKPGWKKATSKRWPMRSSNWHQ